MDNSTEEKNRTSRIIGLGRSKYSTIQVKYGDEVIGYMEVRKGLNGIQRLMMAQSHNILPAILRGEKITIEAV